MTTITEPTNGVRPADADERVLGIAIDSPIGDGLDVLRLPFPPNQISKLPKQQKKDDQDRGKCERGTRYSADGYFCGGWHTRSIHLDYVGHAALTDRLLDADPTWTWDWEQRQIDPEVLKAALATGSFQAVELVVRNSPPLFDRHGGAWILLTVCGVTRRGYADAQGKTGPNAMKELIGDGLRNAAMRFGAALDLWHKGDLHVATDTDDNQPPAQSQRQEPQDTVGDEPRASSGRDWAADVKQLAAFSADTATEDLQKHADALRALHKECKDGYGEMTAALNSQITKAGKALIAEIEARATTPPPAE